ncbi:hypothetical protein BV25DRAFT_1830352 [Artomyces pyxidatus]|uniref:Uncharacterized protein n=1 Tax=Artomyces pyxidatus TaxID=48021 RepID=A0ACB8SQJ3_9AGAM|nr:hypothetical protein BV25DRAFT_1830352 [Artomyces pyxidatus]
MNSLTARSIFRNGTHALGRPAVIKASNTRIMSTSRQYSTMHDNDPDVLDREKRRSLSRKPYQTSSPMDHAPGWNETLASSSEAYVKADKDVSSPHDLVERTMTHTKAKHSPEEAMESGEAMYDLDEISGPLKAAAGATEIVEDTYEEEIEKHEGEWHQSVKKSHLEKNA